MSLIILAGFMIVATEFALLIISGIRQARAIDNSTRAYYAAEGGAESALYQIRKQGVSGSTLIRSSQGATSTGGGSWDLTNNTGGGTFSDKIDSIDRTLLSKNDSVELALYINDGQSATPPLGASSLKVEWNTHNCTTTGHSEPWIEASTVEWTGGAIDWSSVGVKKFFTQGAVKPSGQGYQLVTNALDSTLPSVVRVKTYYCDLRGLKITLFSGADATGTQLAIPNYYLIKPLARAGDATASLQVTMPKKTPTSSIYDYVLFSEQEIVKYR